MKIKRMWITLIILLATCFLPALACNLPGRGSAGISAESLRQTLAAQERSGTSTPLAETPSSQVEAPSPVIPIGPTSTPLPAPGEIAPAGYMIYHAQSGDSLSSVARRFGVEITQISSPQALESQDYLAPGQVLWIEQPPYAYPQTELIFPDSEVINSPTTLDFNIGTFIQNAGGFLNAYQEQVDGQTLSGAQIVQRVAQEASINPRLLLAFLEFRSGWVFGQPENRDAIDYPLGFKVPGNRGLYQELVMAGTHLNIGYYGWRSGTLTNLKYQDGSQSAIDPRLNAGSVAVQNLFAKFYPPDRWNEMLFGQDNFSTRYGSWFGDPWSRAAGTEPTFSPGMSQPLLELPFLPGERWSLTGGPHFSWNTGSPRGAIDFAPVVDEPDCAVSRAWTTAPAAGVIARAANNVVALDLDGDGYEQTGWVVIFLHIASDEMIAPGQTVNLNDRLGHPSCERGQATGTNVHIARKYNGEWLPAEGPIPFILSGWQVFADPSNYQGSMVKGDQQVVANPSGPRTSIIVR